MISIAPEKSSVQSNQSTVDQAYQTQEAEALHIAEEATNNAGEQSGSKTLSLGRVNKYKYEIFEGYAGEEYLKDLVREILPAALYRTWAIAVGYQAPGNACYVGVSRIAQKAKRGERQIQKDRREIELRGLLARYAGSVQVKGEDGTWSRKVRIINDFEGLYDLAYEYHLWRISAEHVPAEWESADYIREDAELYEKLIRFDCYRRILVCEKPGPKTELSDLHKVYEKRRELNKQETEQAENGQQEAKTNKYLPKQLIKRSPYEETKNPESSITYDGYTNSKEDSEEGVLGSAHPRGFVAPTTIRNDQQSTQTGRNTEEQITQRYEEKPKRQENVQDTTQNWRKPNETETPTEQEMPAAGATKDVREYTIEDIRNNPLAVLTFLQQIYAHEQAKVRKQEQARAAKAQRHQQQRQAQRKRRKTPEKLAEVITEMMKTLGGNPQYLQSDLTRATKIYWACTQLFGSFTNPWFLDHLENAFIETANGKGVRKHVPYFFETLERNLGLHNDARAYIRSKEVLYCDGDALSFIMELQQLYHSSGSCLDYDEWVKRTYL